MFFKTQPLSSVRMYIVLKNSLTKNYELLQKRSFRNIKGNYTRGGGARKTDKCY